MHGPAPPSTMLTLAAAKLDKQRDGNGGPPSAQIGRPCKETMKLEKALSTCTVVEFTTLSREMEALTLVSVCDGGVVLCLVVLVLSLCWCCWSPSHIFCSRQDERSYTLIGSFLGIFSGFLLLRRTCTMPTGWNIRWNYFASLSQLVLDTNGSPFYNSTSSDRTYLCSPLDGISLLYQCHELR